MNEARKMRHVNIIRKTKVSITTTTTTATTTTSLHFPFNL